MKGQVNVNGVTLTRAQIEQAMKDLNTPAFVPGDRVRYTGSESGPTHPAFVTGGWVDLQASNDYGPPRAGRIRVTDGCSTWVLPTANFVKVNH